MFWSLVSLGKLDLWLAHGLSVNLMASALLTSSKVVISLYCDVRAMVHWYVCVL